MTELVYIERFRKNGLKFIPKGGGYDVELPIELVSLFEKYEKDGFRHIAIDFKNLSALSNDLIVFIQST